MDSDRHEDSGEMYSPDKQGEYMLLDGTPRFSMQGLFDALADIEEGISEPPTEEYTMMLEVMMADHPGQPHPPMFSWNAGMVMHILKNDPVLRELEHVQVDSPGTAYLFYDKQGHWGLGQDTAYAIRAHVEEAFSEWISHSTHFAISLLPLAENPTPRIPVVIMGESNSLGQLVESTHQQAGRSTTVEEVAEGRLATHAGAVHPHR